MLYNDRMTQGARNSKAQLEHIARLLNCSVQAMREEREGAAILGELLTLWPRLTDDDRQDVLVFAKSLADLRARSGRCSD